jgi:hypothetical protein
MAVIQEYYSSRFDPGAPALVTFLGGFMESRRELNQMAFKEQLAGIDPRAAALVEAAAIKRRTDLEKLAQDAAIARETNDVQKIKSSNDLLGKIVTATIDSQTAMNVARTREGGDIAGREAYRQRTIDSGLMSADNQTEMVATSTRTAVDPKNSVGNTIKGIDNAVRVGLEGGPGRVGVYATTRDPDARDAARAKLYAVGYREALAKGADAAVLADIRSKFGGKTPDEYLSEKFAPRSPEELVGQLPSLGIDPLGPAATAFGMSRSEIQRRLRQEAGIESVAPAAPAGTAPAAGATAPAVTAMPPAAAALTPYGYETELAQAKAMEENARAERLGAAGGGRFSQREVSRANLLYGMPYYRGNPQYDIENLTMGGGAGGAGGTELTEEELAAAGVENMAEPTQVVQVTKKYKRDSMPSGPAYMGGPALQPRGQVSAGEVLPEEREGALSVSALPRFVPVERAAPTGDDLLEAYIEDQRLQGRLRTAAARAAIVESMPTGNK